MKLIKKSRSDINWSGIKGYLANTKINSLKPRVSGDDEISFTSDIDIVIKDITVATNYGKSKISGEMKCKIVSGVYWDYSLEGLEGEELVKTLREHLESELDNMVFSSEIINRREGRVSRKFDGNFYIESHYWGIDFNLDCKILDEVAIEFIDRIFKGNNYQVEVYDDEDNMVDGYYEPDEEKYAIEYAKKHNCNSVERVYLDYILDGEFGDSELNGDREVIWENDNDNIKIKYRL